MADTYKGDDYVVDGAMMYCEGAVGHLQGSTSGPYVRFSVSWDSRRLSICNRPAGVDTDIDFSIFNAQNFGYCKKTKSLCVPQLNGNWLQVCEEVSYVNDYQSRYKAALDDENAQYDAAVIAASDFITNNTDNIYKGNWAELLQDVTKMYTPHPDVQVLTADYNKAIWTTIVEKMEQCITSDNRESFDNAVSIINQYIETQNDILDYLVNLETCVTSKLLLKKSYSICACGGKAIKFATNGQQEFKHDYNAFWIDEKVHIVIKSRTNNRGFFCKKSMADKDRETDYIGLAPMFSIMGEMKSIDSSRYKANEYGLQNRVAEAFLPMVLPGSTYRCLDKEYQKTYIETMGDEYSADEGTAFQEDVLLKRTALLAQIKTAQKLAYMLYYGEEFSMEKYNEDKDNTEMTEEQKGKVIYNPIEEYAKDPNQFVDESNYGLWGKWYSTTLGWHRGIDTCSGGTVHAIMAGVVTQVGRSSSNIKYCISVYNCALDVTVTYMHLNLYTYDENAVDYTKPDFNESRTCLYRHFERGNHIYQGELLGFQGGFSYSSKNTADQPFDPHTHVEINAGKYLDSEDATLKPVDTQDVNYLATDEEKQNGTRGGNFICPWSTYKKEINLENIKENYNFSQNPYPIIEQAWKMRGGE